MPHKIFPSQMEDETIYLVVRQHWMQLFLKLLVWAFVASPLVLFRMYGPTYIPGLFEGSYSTVTKLFEEAYGLLLATSLFIIWILYYLNMQVITNLRVVDIDQVGLFSHSIAELHIDKIEDVTSETKGVLGTVFNYGAVFIQTAGTKEHFEFENVPNPAVIEKLILDLYEKNSNFAKDTR